MIKKQINSSQTERQNQFYKGFTIVELLIVVVVIAILAAITIVSYNGITQKANTSSAQATASTLVKKSEIYNADPTTPAGYPATFSVLTANGQMYTVTTSSVAFRDTTKVIGGGYTPTSPGEFNFFACGTNGTTSAPANYAGITSFTGIKVITWNFSTKSAVTSATGVTSGNVGTSPVACFQSNT